MTDREQANRLKVAGWKFEKPVLIPTDMAGNPFEVPDKIPSERELMEWLKEYGYPVWNPYLNKWVFRSSIIFVMISDIDLTECLVQAVEAVLKGRGEECPVLKKYASCVGE